MSQTSNMNIKQMSKYNVLWLLPMGDITRNTSIRDKRVSQLSHQLSVVSQINPASTCNNNAQNSKIPVSASVGSPIKSTGIVAVTHRLSDIFLSACSCNEYRLRSDYFAKAHKRRSFQTIFEQPEIMGII